MLAAMALRPESVAAIRNFALTILGYKILWSTIVPLAAIHRVFNSYKILVYLGFLGGILSRWLL